MCLCFKTNKFILIPTRKNNYLYNAKGQKVAKKITNNSTVTVTDYQGIFHYGNGDLKFLRSEEHTSELQSRENLVCRLLLEKKKKKKYNSNKLKRICPRCCRIRRNTIMT